MAAVLAVPVVLFGLIVAIAATVYFVIDKDDAKAFAARTASAAVGRRVEIRGDAGVDPGWVTRIHLEGLVLGNAAWSKTDDLAAVKSLDIAIDVRKLLRGAVVLPEVTASGIRVLLEKNAQGEANWNLSAGAKATADAAAPETRSEIPRVDKLAVDDLRLRYRDPTTDRSLDLDLDQLRVADDREAARVRVSADGAFQSRPLKVRFAGGSWEMLLAAQDPYPIDLDATIADLKIKAAGTIDDPVKAEGVALKVDVRGDDLSKLYPISGIALPPSPPYAFSGRVDRAGATWRFRDATGRLGGSDIRGAFGVDTGGKRLRLTADATSDLLDYKDLAPFIGAKPGGREGQKISGEEAIDRRGGKVLPDKPIDLERLNAMDADVTFAAKRIEVPGLPIDRLRTKLKLEGGNLRIDPAEFALAKGKVRTSLALRGSSTPVKVDIDTRIERIDLKSLAGDAPFAQKTAGRLGGRVNLQATGTSAAQILGSANGDLFLVMSDGSISHLLVELAGLDIAESLGVVIGGDEAIPIRCIVADFGAQQGVFNSRTLLVDTTDTNIGGRGRIDMRQETIDVTLTPLSKDFSPLSLRTPIRIQGTFAEPTAFPDPVEIGVDTTVKKVVNAILTPLIGLLPPIDAGVGQDSDCSALIARAKAAG